MKITVVEAQQLPIWFFEKCQVIYNPRFQHSTKGSKPIQVKAIVALDNQDNEYSLHFTLHGHDATMFVPGDTQIEIHIGHRNVGEIIVGEE